MTPHAPPLRLGFLACFALGWLSASGAAMAGDDPPARDRFGDPLPPGAVARLGTGRFRNGMFKPFFFPDGKTLLTASRQSLQIWETASGRLLREIPTATLFIHEIALSPNGTQAAAKGVLLDAPALRPALRVWDVATGKEVRTIALAENARRGLSLTFTPDGRQLVTIPGGAVVFEDIASGKEVRRRQFSTDILPSFALAPDGETVAVAPGANTRKFYLWNSKSDEQPRELKVPRRPLHSLCFDPAGKVLAGCDQMASAIDLWDVSTGKVVSSIDMSKEAVCASDLAFSPDGKLLAVADSGNRKNFSGGLYLWDLERGRYFRQLLTPGEQVLFANFSRDGRWIAATTTGGVHVWELPLGREVGRSEDVHRGSLTRIAVSARGLTATASHDHTVRIWETISGRPKGKLQHDQPVSDVILTPDGKRAFTATSMDNTLRCWDLTSGREIERFPGQKRFAAGRALALTPDGRRLLSWADNRTLRVWDIQKGKMVREHAIPPGPAGKSKRERDARREWLALGMGPCCFTPNGEHFILSFRKEFRIYETATGKEWQVIPDNGGQAIFLTVSGDGRALLVGCTDIRGGRNDHYTVSLWELATGQLRDSWPFSGRLAGPIALSRDGRLLAVGLSAVPGEIRLIDTARHRPVRTFAGFTGRPTLLSFSFDDRLLISGMDDTSALVWRVPPTRERPADPLEWEAVGRLWNDLAGADAARAYRAILRLAQSPAEAVAFLDKQLQPTAEPDPKRIAQLLKDLDDDRFEVRSKGELELEKWGELIESDLKTALAAKPSLEARRRMEQLLSKLRGSIRTPTIVQRIRAIEALERMDTAEARRVLAKLARGASGARQTREAQAALHRSTNRPPKLATDEHR